jgi:hypothetical protein
MSRSGFYYAVNAMERVATGTAAGRVPDVPARPAVARQAPTAGRPEGSIVALRRRILAAVRLGMGGARGQGSRRLRGPARAD